MPHGRPKLEALILYIAHRMERDRHVGRGRIKLAKLLFKIDFAAYARWGKPVTEATYWADELGPAPAEELMTTRDLEAAGSFRWQPGRDKQQLPVAKGTPTLDLFAEHERTLIEEMLTKYRWVSGNAMVDEAHVFPGWVLAWRDGEGENAPIPFESIFWNPRKTEVEPWENEHAATLVARYSL